MDANIPELELCSTGAKGAWLRKFVMEEWLAVFSSMMAADKPRPLLRNSLCLAPMDFGTFTTYIMLCFTLKTRGLTSDWHPLFQIPNSRFGFQPFYITEINVLSPVEL